MSTPLVRPSTVRSEPKSPSHRKSHWQSTYRGERETAPPFLCALSRFSTHRIGGSLAAPSLSHVTRTPIRLRMRQFKRLIHCRWQGFRPRVPPRAVRSIPWGPSGISHSPWTKKPALPGQLCVLPRCAHEKRRSGCHSGRSGVLFRLLTSAIWSVSIARPQSGIPSKRQISRERFDSFRRTIGTLAVSGLRRHQPTRPAPYASYPVLVHRLAPLRHASFGTRLATVPLSFARTSPLSGCPRDCHPQAAKHVRHTKLRGSGQPLPLFRLC